MEFLYTSLLVILVAILLIGLVQARASSTQSFYRRNAPLITSNVVLNPIDPSNPIDPTKEYFSNPTQATQSQQLAGSSIAYQWGMPTETAVSKKCTSGDCPSPPSRSCTKGCDDSKPGQSTCNQCDILKHKDIKYFTLKSSIPSCPDMSEYVKKSQIPAVPDMKDYVKKSEIPACPKCPDMKDYVPKSSIPTSPECPRCPVCPVCPVCPETYDRVEEDPRFGRAFANADIRKHPDISKYVLKSEAESAMENALELQAKDILTNLRCPPCGDGSSRHVEVQVKDQATGAIVNPKLKVHQTKDVKVEAVQLPNVFGSIFPDLSKQNATARRLPHELSTTHKTTEYDFVFKRPTADDAARHSMNLMDSLRRGVNDVVGGFFSGEQKMREHVQKEKELDQRSLENVPAPASSGKGNGAVQRNVLKSSELPAMGSMPEIWTDSVLPSKSCSVPMAQ